MRRALIALAAAALGGCTYDTCGLGGQTGDVCWICGWFEDACTERPPDGTCVDQDCQLPAPPLLPSVEPAAPPGAIPAVCPAPPRP